MSHCDAIAECISRASSCVVLTGAGISAESGVPTFRGKEGLWGKFKPEELATMDAFMANPELVWEWYRWRRDLLNKVKPNAGHRALCELEQLSPRFTLITQNVDGLHRQAGSQNVLELHGNIMRNKCATCGSPFDSTVDIDPHAIPACPNCGGQIRPDIVWFGELLDSETIDAAFAESDRADVFISIGTSAIVQPAATLPVSAKRSGATLIEINPEATPLSDIADYRIDKPAGKFLPRLVERVKALSGRAADQRN